VDLDSCNIAARAPQAGEAHLAADLSEKEPGAGQEPGARSQPARTGPGDRSSESRSGAGTLLALPRGREAKPPVGSLVGSRVPRARVEMRPQAL
jgi:hypothetical protein